MTFTTAAGVTGARERDDQRQGQRRPDEHDGGAGPGRRLTAPLHSAAMSDDHATPEGSAPVGTGAWVVLPTYDEAENLPGIAAAILEALPGATLLVVDDASPDGTGELADRLAADDPRIRVRHRPGKAGLGSGVPRRVRGRARGRRLDRPPDGRRLVARSRRSCPASSRPIEAGSADLVIGSRYTKGGGVEDWGLARRVISRGGSLFAKVVLRLPANDLTGGFKAWRAATLSAVPFDGVRAGGYVFQIEMTYRASRLGARVREVPITFRDRRVGRSKMSRRIIVEALLVVLRLRWEELAAAAGARGPGRSAERSADAIPPGAPNGGPMPEPPSRPIRGARGACIRRSSARDVPATDERAPVRVRVVMDVRPLQDPEHAPVTAAYLEGLLGAVDASPLAGESFAFLLASDLDDPTTRFDRLDIVGRRLLPPTRLLRSAALRSTRSSSVGRRVGAGWRIEKAWRRGRRVPRGGRRDAAGVGVAGRRHAARPCAVAAAEGLPALGDDTLRAATSRAARPRGGRGHRDERRRGSIGAPAGARPARPPPDHPARTARGLPSRGGGRRGQRPGTGGAARAERERLGLPERYLVYAGRYDARQDLTTLLRALSLLAAAGRPSSLPDGQAWPPRVCLLGATPADRASLARVAGREGVGDLLAYTPRLPVERAAALVRGRPGGAPAGRLRGGGPRRDRGTGGGRPGRRERRGTDGRARRAGRDPGRAAGPGTPGGGARRPPGPTTRCTPARRRGARAIGVPADVARRRRADACGVGGRRRPRPAAVTPGVER